MAFLLSRLDRRRNPARPRGPLTDGVRRPARARARRRCRCAGRSLPRWRSTELLPPARVRFQRARARPATVEARFAIADGYYLYRDKLNSAWNLRRWRRRRCCRRARSRKTSSSARWRRIAATGRSSGAGGARRRAISHRDRRIARLRRRRRLLPAATAEVHASPLPAAGAGPGRRVEAVSAEEELVQMMHFDRLARRVAGR